MYPTTKKHEKPLKQPVGVCLRHRSPYLTHVENTDQVRTMPTRGQLPVGAIRPIRRRCGYIVLWDVSHSNRVPGFLSRAGYKRCAWYYNPQITPPTAERIHDASSRELSFTVYI
ncbi:uncharacterized protein LOC127282024 [Leptopilina boulardi]|uniref:uncharacterized protein LOC127282024 n=1 Tax=Leptopilina boulardi TaxID=63433 RepID=UPI0021F55DF0|nr:uncharacterized protein LOC127282024 [Leptopilina boulardi]